MEESKSTVICAVPGCKAYLEDGIKMHKFPKGFWNKIWLIAIEPSDKVRRKSKAMFACSSHFSETEYRVDKINSNIKRLKSTAVPTLNLDIMDHNIVNDDTDNSSSDIDYGIQPNLNLNTENKPPTILKIDLPRMCRICLKNDSKTYNIFSSFQMEEESSKTIAEIIMICTNIIILGTDKFPKVICEFCLSDLQRAYCFKRNCEKSDKMLIAYAKEFMNEISELSFTPKTFAAQQLKEKIKQNILSYIKFQTTGNEIKCKENMFSETEADLPEEIDNNKHEELEAKCNENMFSESIIDLPEKIDNKKHAELERKCDSDTDVDTCSIASDDPGDDDFIVEDSGDDDDSIDYEPADYSNDEDSVDDNSSDTVDDNYVADTCENLECKETECHNYKRKLRPTSYKNNPGNNVSEIYDTPNNNIIPEQCTDESDYLIPSKRLCTNSVASSENLLLDSPTISTKDKLNDKHNSTSTPNSTYNDFLKELQQVTKTRHNFQETATDLTKNTNYENASKSNNGEEIVNNASNNSTINSDKSQKFINVEISYIPTVPFNIPRELIAPVDIQVLGDTGVENRNANPQHRTVCYPNTTNQGPARLPKLFYFENQNSISQYKHISTVVTKNTLPKNKKNVLNRGGKTIDTISSNQNQFFYPILPKTHTGSNVRNNFEITKNTSQPQSMQTPSMQSLSVQTPSMQTPSMQTPSMQTPSMQTPSMQTPSMQTPSMQTPSMQTPSMHTPSMQTPSMQTPSMQTPSMQIPSMQTPSVQTPSMQTPSMQTPSMQISSMQTPSMQTPSMQTPSMQTPSMQTPSMQAPAMQTSNSVSLQNSNNTFIVPQTNTNYYVIQNSISGNTKQINVPHRSSAQIISPLSVTNNIVANLESLKSVASNKLQRTNYMNDHIITQNQQNTQMISVIPTLTNAVFNGNSYVLYNLHKIVSAEEQQQAGQKLSLHLSKDKN